MFVCTCLCIYICTTHPDTRTQTLRFISKDRFDRVLRYWARGPLGCETALTEEPWVEVNWMIDGHNARRKKEFRCGSRITPDESMVTWTGNAGPGGIPHLSFIRRKPKPLGAEFKSVCDGSTGLCMFLETQEGKIRMQRKLFCDSYPATTACTVRMCQKMGLSETALPVQNKLKRRITADSWFCSRRTVMACTDELGMEFTGPVKTATKGFPAEAMRWTLSTMERGEHVVFKEEGRKLWAVGWVDVHYKLYLTTHGSSDEGDPAQKKRQRLDGRNYKIQVPRPTVIANYAKEMGWVDRHNRYRQSMLGLSEVWKTKRWQSRIQLEVMGIALVDAFLLARKFMPKWRGMPDTEGVFWKFVRVLLPQLTESPNLDTSASSTAHRGCVQILIGKAVVQSGPKKGQYYAKQGRCSYCVANNRKEVKGNGSESKRSPRTAYTCIAHPNEYICKAGKGNGCCWQEHLAAVAETDSNDGSGEEENGYEDADDISRMWGSSTSTTSTPASSASTPGRLNLSNTAS